MLHEKPVDYGLLVDDVDETNMVWTGEKRRRKYSPESSSSDAPTANAQEPISQALFGAGEAAKDHQDPISDMAIIQEQDHALLPRAESGEEEEETQELFGPHVILSEEDQANYVQKLAPDVSLLDSMTPSMSWPEKFEVLARHARYRVAYYKIVEPESGRKLKDPYEYSVAELREQGYFKYLEEDGGFEWFFHTDDIWNPDLDDYKRIALRTMLPDSIKPEYRDVDEYHNCHNTYEMDSVYVKFYGKISKKIKWIEDYLYLDERTAAWKDMETRGWRQALRIATNLPHMTRHLAALAYNEYISELRKDAALKDLDLVYFEIWRHIVKDNLNYIDAVKSVHAMEKFNMHKFTMEGELTGAPVFWTMKQRIYGIIHKGDIVADTEDNKARDLFRTGVAQLKTKNLVKYAEKKMEIAERLNLHKRIEVP